MKARALPQQKTEAWISASALNRMTNLGMPVSVKIEKWPKTEVGLAKFRLIQQRRTSLGGTPSGDRILGEPDWEIDENHGRLFTSLLKFRLIQQRSGDCTGHHRRRLSSAWFACVGGHTKIL